MNDDPNKSYIQAIKLPSGNTYYIKDGEARAAITSAETAIASHSADIESLQQMIAGGVSFNIVWTASDYANSTPPKAIKLATIPAGVTIYYANGGASTTGTLEASEATIGKFYLIYSKTQEDSNDKYDEYVTVGEYYWEKIGDTQVDLSDVVTNVVLNTGTVNVIGSAATFNVTQPTITPSVNSVVTSVSPTTTYLGATATGGGASWNSKDSKTVITGVGASTTNVKATASGGGASWNSKDAKTVLTGVKANTTNVKATASGGGAAWNSKDLKTVVTSVSASTARLATTSIKTLSASNTTASKATAGTNQTTLKNTFKASTANTDWLKGATVSNEVLSLGAATYDTQTTTQFTFSDVTVPVRNDIDIVVATGQTTTGLGGADIATGVEIGSSVSVIGQNATFTNTQPTIALSSGATAGTGVIALAYEAAANGTASVIGSSATLSNTQPTIALSSGATAGTGVIALAYNASATGTASVIGYAATLTNTQPTVSLSSGSTSGTGKVQVATQVESISTTLTATATGANVSWNSKDQKTVITTASLSVYKGNSSTPVVIDNPGDDPTI